MGKWTQNMRRTGAALCAGVFLLTGCGSKEVETTPQEKPQKVQQETPQEEAKHLQAAEHPAFIPDGVRKFVLVQDGEEIFQISREPADYKMEFDYWEILKPYDEHVTVNTEEMYKLFDALCNFEFQTPVTLEEGADTGIAESSTGFLLEFVDTLDVQKAKQTGDADSAAEIVIGKEDGQGNRYAAIKGKEEQIYLLPADLVESVYALKPFNYILKIPVLINAETLQGMEITAGGKTYKIQINAAEEIYKLDRKKVEKKEFAALYQEIASVMLASEIPENSNLKEKKPELSIFYQRNTETAPDVTVSYYAFDDTFDVVEINGAQRFLVKAEDVEALKERIADSF